MKIHYEIGVTVMDNTGNNSVDIIDYETRYTWHSAEKSAKKILDRILKGKEKVEFDVFYVFARQYKDRDGIGMPEYQAGLDWDFHTACYSRLNPDNEWKEIWKF